MVLDKCNANGIVLYQQNNALWTKGNLVQKSIVFEALYFIETV